jgi:predicted ATP-grasp superfamily ATP-dependent carboligase
VIDRVEQFAVVLGLSPTGLYVIRELGAAGIPVLGVTQSLEAGRYSRFLNMTPKTLIESTEGRLVEQLLALAEKAENRGVLIPASDYFIEFVVRHAEELAVLEKTWTGSRPPFAILALSSRL